MNNVIGVRFKDAGKIYYFDPKDFSIEKDDHVIVETARGIEYGQAVIVQRQVADKDLVLPLKPVIRKADPLDDRINEENKQKAKDALDICEIKAKEHQLDMKLVDCEYTFDNNKVIFYFTADGRIDFRNLVKDLATIFKTRIELRQIGVRDQAKIVGGLGPCGQVCCCHRYMGDFVPVSIKMAKEQELSLNPTKISGICGRLMCCLNYEHQIYEDNLKELPPVGTLVETAEGKGIVVEVLTLLKKMKVRLTLEDGSEDFGEYDFADVKILDRPAGKYRKKKKGGAGPSAGNKDKGQNS